MRSLMYEVWSQSLRQGPNPGASLPSGALNRIESHWRADKRRRFVKYKLVPLVFGAAYVVAALAILTWLFTGAADGLGFICGRSEPPAAQSAMPLIDPCHDTGVPVAEGETYRILVSVAEPWFDKSIPAGPDGLAYEDFGSRLAMMLAVPLRRHISQDWFAVMAKIEPDGLNSRALELRRVEGTEAAGNETWEAEFTADANGELFLYVNDTVLFGYTGFYGNNRGSARIAIELKAR